MSAWVTFSTFLNILLCKYCFKLPNIYITLEDDGEKKALFKEIE